MSAQGRAFRQRLKARETIFGSFLIELPSPSVPEALAQSGFHAVVVDTEHSAFSLDQVQQLVVACRAAGVASIIRVGDPDRAAITRAADIAPDGLMFPNIGSSAEASAIIEAAKYAPAGSRGVCPMVRYNRIDAERRYQSLNDGLALILQIEGENALAEAPSIAALPAVDAIFVGTYDLSQSLGVPGQIDHPRVLEAGRGLRSSLPVDTALSVYVQSPEMAFDWLSAGATFLTYATDGQLLLSACSLAGAELRELARRITPSSSDRG